MYTIVRDISLYSQLRPCVQPSSRSCGRGCRPISPRRGANLRLKPAASSHTKSLSRLLRTLRMSQAWGRCWPCRHRRRGCHVGALAFSRSILAGERAEVRGDSARESLAQFPRLACSRFSPDTSFEQFLALRGLLLTLLGLLRHLLHTLPQRGGDRVHTHAHVHVLGRCWRRRLRRRRRRHLRPGLSGNRFSCLYALEQFCILLRQLIRHGLRSCLRSRRCSLRRLCPLRLFRRPLRRCRCRHQLGRRLSCRLPLLCLRCRLSRFRRLRLGLGGSKL